MRLVRLLFIATLCSAAGCARNTVNAAANRFPSPTAGARLRQPICFLPTPANAGLAARATHEETSQACADGARQSGVTVVPAGTPNCLVVGLWFDPPRPTESSTECRPSIWGYYAANCTTTQLYQKVLRVKIFETLTNETLLEAVSSVSSTTSTTTPPSVYALCRAAFHDYPAPARNAQFEVDLGDR